MPRLYDTCPKCRAFLDPGTGECPYCGVELRIRRPRLWKLFLKRPASNTILATIVVLFGAELYMEQAVGPSHSATDALTHPSMLMLDRLGANAYDLNVVEGEGWRFVTAIFLHGGILHLLFNGWALLTLAPICEEVYGAARFWTVYLLAGIAGNFASFQWALWRGHYFSNVGASGALCGLIGLLLVFRRGEGWDVGAESVRRTMRQWLFQTVLFGLLVPGIDNAAHLGGAAAGLLLGLLLGSRRVRRGRGWERFFWRPAATALAGLLVFSFGAMIASQTKWRAAEDWVALTAEVERLTEALDEYPGGTETRERVLGDLRAMEALPVRDPALAGARDGLARAVHQVLEEGPIGKARRELADASEAYASTSVAYAKGHGYRIAVTLGARKTQKERR